MITGDENRAVRVAAFEFLNAIEIRTGERAVRREDVVVVEFRGRRIPLMPTQQGIRKPAGMDTAAYDANIMGISPSYEIELRHDILEEVDGPTLRYALQGLHGESILTPRSRRDRPDRELLTGRFRQFRAARS